MKSKYYSLFIVAMFVLGTSTSCDHLLDIPQKGVLDYSSYYQTDEQVQSAADALYIQFKNMYYNYDLIYRN